MAYIISRTMGPCILPPTPFPSLPTYRFSIIESTEILVRYKVSGLGIKKVSLSCHFSLSPNKAWLPSLSPDQGKVCNHTWAMSVLDQCHTSTPLHTVHTVLGSYCVYVFIYKACMTQAIIFIHHQSLHLALFGAAHTYS